MGSSLSSLGDYGAMTRRRLGLAALICMVLPAAARAAPLTEADKRAVRQVIEAQLEAFAAGDAARAYAYASPEIQAGSAMPTTSWQWCEAATRW